MAQEEHFHTENILRHVMFYATLYIHTSVQVISIVVLLAFFFIIMHTNICQ